MVDTVSDSNASEHDVSGILYHYTDSHGLSGILQSRELWASSLQNLNDPLESQYFFDRVRTELESRCEFPGIPFPPDYERLTLYSVYQSLTPSAHTKSLRSAMYVSSFSEDGDLLSQWRACADAGFGFSIGFSNLHEFTKESFRLDKSTTTQLIRVRYEESKVTATVTSLVDSLLEYLEECKGKTYGDDSDTTHGTFMTSCLLHSLTVKRIGFREEQESRLIGFSPPLTNVSHPLDVRIKDKSLVPFMRIPLTSDDRSVDISEIVIGPRNNFTVTKCAVEILLKKFGYGQGNLAMPRIVQSKTSLR